MKDRLEKQFWISPKGDPEYLEEDIDPISVHFEIAKKFYPEERYPEDRLMAQGWIKVGSTSYLGASLIHSEPTQSQLDTLFDLGLWGRLQIKRGSRYTQWSETDL